MREFEFLAPLLEGTLIGLFATLSLMLLGRIAGVSEIVAGRLLAPNRTETSWRAGRPRGAGGAVHGVET